MEQHLLELYRKTVPTENLELIPLQFLCDVFGIDYQNQYRKLSKDKVYDGQLKQKANEELYGDSRLRYHLTRKGFIRWVFQISPSIVTPELKEDFIEYQSNVVEYLWDNAIQQEAILKEIEVLKRKRKTLYDKLHAENPEFGEYMNIVAQIARLGKDNKEIQQKIAGNQISIEFVD